MKTRKSYPSDLTHAQWQQIELLFPAPKPPGSVGRPQEHDYREIVNAILYLLRNACAWRALPHDLPPHESVRAYFRKWQENGLLDRIHDTLRQRVRRQNDKEPTPSAVIVDSQSVKTTEKGGRKNLSKLSATTRAKRSKDVNAISSSTR
jgi:transposase